MTVLRTRKLVAATVALGALVLTASQLAAAATRHAGSTSCSRPAARHALARMDETVTVVLEADSTCAEDQKTLHQYTNDTDKAEQVVMSASNQGQCTLYVDTPKATYIVRANGQQAAKLTLKPGEKITARCQSNAGTERCKFTVTIAVPAPKASITVPADHAEYRVGTKLKAKFRCSSTPTCVGTVPNGAPIDTAALGPHTFSVTASDANGHPRTTTVTYFVVPRPVTEARAGMLK